jgi:hypothetical protein
MFMNETDQRSLARYARSPNALIGMRRRKSPQGAAFILFNGLKSILCALSILGG